MFPVVRRPAFLVFVALLLCAGCDLGEYEKREDDERTRVAYFDAENKAVGDPIHLPRHKVAVVFTNKKGQPDKKFEPNPVLKLDVFLRPPVGYSGRIQKDDEVNPFNNVLYRYAPSRDLIHNLFVGAVIDKKKTPDEFLAEVRTALEQFYAKAYNKLIRFDPKTKTKTDRRQPPKTRYDPGQLILFQTVTYSDGLENGVQFQVFLYKAGADQVAIVFEMANGEERRFVDGIDFSLKTFDIRAGAANKRRTYSRPG